MLLWIQAIGLVVFTVNYSLAINCYICDSSINPKCANLTDRSIKPEPCTYDKLVSDGSDVRVSWLQALSELHYFKDSSSVEIPMVCQKIVGTDEQHQQTTLRRCQLDNVPPCDFSRNQILKSGTKRIDFCDVCGTDNCNAANRPGREQLIALVAVCIAALAVGRRTMWPTVAVELGGR